MKSIKQLSLAETGFLPKVAKQSWKAVFLSEMETVVPWSRLEALIEPLYPKKGNCRPPIPLGAMLRIHFMQQWSGYPVPAMEEALHIVPVLRQFARLGSFEDVMPDESTILHFRHLLEQNELAAAIFAEVNVVLSEKGPSMKHGFVVDATLIAAPSSTKNHKCDELTEQQKKSNWILSAIRALVEHSFRVIRQQFGFTKVRYRGLKKNTGQIVTLFALSNLWMARHRLMTKIGEVRP
jgi:transposase, IS5 family